MATKALNLDIQDESFLDDPLFDLSCSQHASSDRGRVIEFPILKESLGTNLGYCVLLEDIFSIEECMALIARAEEHGFEPALVNIGG